MIFDYLKCPICLNEGMQFFYTKTMEAFSDDFDLEDVDKLVDGIIGQYLVFQCLKCESIHRFTYKEIEKSIRKDISQKVMTLRAKKELDKTINMNVKYLVFCGKCNGYDGHGACPKEVYDECQLRRMPYVI